MAVTINGTTGVAGVDGSASTPALQGTDTNTGITFPAADTVAIATGGTERMRVNSSGNVGIGTTSPSSRLDVYDTQGRYRIDPAAVSGSVINYSVNQGQTAYITQIYDASSHQFRISATEQARIDTSGNFQFNSGYGSVATAYGCRAWVNFNGTGTVAIRGSGNVTSITDNGVGTYTINMTNAMPDTNYAFVGTSRETATNGVSVVVDATDLTARTTTAFKIQTIGTSSFGLYDSAYNNIAVFR